MKISANVMSYYINKIQSGFSSAKDIRVGARVTIRSGKGWLALTPGGWCSFLPGVATRERDPREYHHEWATLAILAPCPPHRLPRKG